MSRNKIIAVDFDGTLCRNAYPAIGEPNEAVIDYIVHQKETGAQVILWTCRRDEMLNNAIEWCRERGITFDAVNENLPWVIDLFGDDTRKVYADEYLDDKAVALPTKINTRRRRTMSKMIR